jgi:hypothetical protein
MSVDNNLLPTNGFKVLIGGTKEYPKLNTFAVKVTLPAVNQAGVSTQYRNEPGFVPSESLDYDPLSITFLCDEKMGLYDELYDWMRTNSLSDTFQTDDIIINLLTSHNNVSRNVRCTNAFPTGIGSVEFNAQSSEVTYATFDISFRFDEFEFID